LPSFLFIFPPLSPSFLFLFLLLPTIFSFSSYPFHFNLPLLLNLIRETYSQTGPCLRGLFVIVSPRRPGIGPWPTRWDLW
jgi:hypothetical protein